MLGDRKEIWPVKTCSNIMWKMA